MTTGTVTMYWLYGRVAFTIVAANGQNFMAGLPGVRVESRHLRQKPCQISPVYTSTLADHIPEKAGRVSVGFSWMDFPGEAPVKAATDLPGGQMTWHCRSAIAHEHMMATDKRDHYPSLSWFSLRKRHSGKGSKIDGSIMVFRDKTTHLLRSETFKQYAKLIEEYTHRRLTNDSDVLNALQGLLHIFPQSFGLPMRSWLPEILFDVALLWKRIEMLVQRKSKETPKSPTWTWAGWKGRVTYEEPFEAGLDKNAAI